MVSRSMRVDVHLDGKQITDSDTKEETAGPSMISYVAMSLAATEAVHCHQICHTPKEHIGGVGLCLGNV